MTNTPPPKPGSFMVKAKAKKQSERLAFVNEDQMVSLFATSCPNAKRFRVHKEFACHYSPILKAAFNSTLVEGQTQKYRFEDQKDDTLHQLVFWLYTQKLDIILEPALSFNRMAKEVQQMAQLWILGDKLFIRPLQNLALEKLSQLYKINGKEVFLYTNHLNFIYNSTVDESSLRKYVARYCAQLVDFERVDRRTLWTFPSEMLLDIIILSKSGILMDKDKKIEQIDWTDYKVAED